MMTEIKTHDIAKKFILFYICSLYIGPEMLSIDVGFMHLNIGRILQPIIVVMCLYKISKLSFERPLRVLSSLNTYSLCFFALWMGYALLSFIWAMDNYAWLRACYYLLSGIITIFVLSLYFDTLEDIRQLLCISMVMTLLHALIGYYEVKSGNYLFLLDSARATDYIRNGLPVSSMNNVNDFATVMLMGVYSTIAVYLTTHKKTVRFLSLFILFFLLMMIGFSGSRGVILGGCLSLLVLLYMPTIRKKLILTGTIIMLVSILVTITLPDIRNYFIQFCNTTFRLDFGHENSSDTVRLNLILNGFVYLKRTLFMGTGLGNIEYYMLNYPLLDTKNIVNIHNWWMEILVSSGLFIFIGYCIFYWYLSKHMWLLSKYATYSCIKNIGTVMLAFLIAFTIASVSSSSLMGNNLVWLYFAIMVSFERISFKHGNYKY